MPSQPTFTFTHPPSSSAFAVSKKDYLKAHPSSTFHYIATSALVLDKTTCPSNPRILLLQRASSDSLPNKWEPPGGACDDNDESILHAAARELREEAGLQATRIQGPIGEPYFFTLRNGGLVCQFSFVVEVEVEVDGGGMLVPRLNPEEHQRFVWATEEEVKMGVVGGEEVVFTREGVRGAVLEALRWVGEGQHGGM